MGRFLSQVVESRKPMWKRWELKLGEKQVKIMADGHRIDGRSGGCMRQREENEHNHEDGTVKDTFEE